MSPLAPVPLDDEPELAAAEPESEFNLAEYLGMLRRHWKLAAVCCVLGLAGAGIHYAITPKAVPGDDHHPDRAPQPDAARQRPEPLARELLEHGVLPHPVRAAAEPRPGRAGGQEPRPDGGPGLQSRRRARARAASSGATAEDDEAVLGAPRRPAPRRPLGRAGAQHPARAALLPRRLARVRRQGRQRLRRGVHRHGGRGPLRHRRQGLHLPLLADRDAEAGDPGQGDPAPGVQPPQRHRDPRSRGERHPASGWRRSTRSYIEAKKAAHREGGRSTTR